MEQEKLNILRREVKKIEIGLDGYEIFLLQEEINSKSSNIIKKVDDIETNNQLYSLQMKTLNDI